MDGSYNRHDLYWHFASTDGGDVRGVNDPIAGLFYGDKHEDQIAREVIQNSIDASQPDKKVRIQFERLDLQWQTIPGFKEVRAIRALNQQGSGGLSHSSEIFTLNRSFGHRRSSVVFCWGPASQVKIPMATTLGINARSDQHRRCHISWPTDDHHYIISLI